MLCEIGTADPGTSFLTVGLIAYNAARLAGEMMDPSVSSPKEKVANPADTATAEPVEEPLGSKAGSKALFVWPPRGDQPLGWSPKEARK